MGRAGEGCTPPGSMVLALAESPEQRGWEAGMLEE